MCTHHGASNQQGRGETHSHMLTPRSSATFSRQHLLLPLPASCSHGWSGNKSLRTGMKFSPRTRKSRRKVIWKMNGKHSIAEVLCFPTGKKKQQSFPTQVLSTAKEVQKSHKKLPCCCFTGVNHCRTKRTRVFRNSQPVHCQKSSLRSLCTLHKNTSGDRITADPAPFYPTPISVLVQ